MKELAGQRRSRNCARGSGIVEFALVAIFYFSLVFLTFNFFFWAYAKAALYNGVREGVRYAITGRTAPTLGQDDSIKKAVMDNAFGLLSSSSDKIKVEYFAASGSGSTNSNAAGNIVVVSVLNYTPPTIAPVLGFSLPISLTVKAVDKVEPFSGTPPPRTLPP